MGNQIDSTIISLAILKVNWDKNKGDYLDIFVPIVAEAIRLSENDIITSQDLQKDIISHFKLVIPQNTLNTILPRVTKKGYIQQKEKAYHRNIEKLSGYKEEFYKVQQQVIKLYDEFIEKFIIFCKDKFELEDITQEKADEMLQDYLKLNQFSPKSIFPKGRSQSKKSNQFYVGSFIQNLEITNSSLLQNWGKIVTGYMLSNSIYLSDAYLPNPSQLNQKFKDTSLFFDTQFLIRLLGYAGERRETPCLELVSLLHTAGATLKCFKHTLDEIYGILEQAVSRLENGLTRDLYGETIEYFIENGKSPSDIKLYINNLERLATVH